MVRRIPKKPSKGSVPDRIAKMVHARDQISDGKSNDLPRSLSGAQTADRTKDRESLSLANERKALPKSEILMDPSNLRVWVPSAATTAYRGRPSNLVISFRTGIPKYAEICCPLQASKLGICNSTLPGCKSESIPRRLL